MLNLNLSLLVWIQLKHVVGLTACWLAW